MGSHKNIKWELQEYRDGELIGLRVLDKENGDTLFDTGLKGCVYEEEEENAKLIAAAPEMLEMLESILKMQKENYGDGTSTHMLLMDKAPYVESLIKKATE